MDLRWVRALSQKFVDEVSPRSGRKIVAHGVRSCENIGDRTVLHSASC
jgi:hypothetical protein